MDYENPLVSLDEKIESLQDFNDPGGGLNNEGCYFHPEMWGFMIQSDWVKSTKPVHIPPGQEQEQEASTQKCLGKKNMMKYVNSQKLNL